MASEIALVLVAVVKMAMVVAADLDDAGTAVLDAGASEEEDAGSVDTGSDDDEGATDDDAGEEEEEGSEDVIAVVDPLFPSSTTPAAPVFPSTSTLSQLPERSPYA